MNYFDVWAEGLGMMDIRRIQGMPMNEGLLHPISETAIEIEGGVSLKDLLFFSGRPESRERAPDLF